ncbi:MAG: TIGR02099 family protein [Endozoicomonadaceae bacterium]|nr:TIGR02099 family protein [Endozoicomonadaceae bacterium]
MKRLVKAGWLAFVAIIVVTVLLTSAVRLLWPKIEISKEEFQVRLGSALNTKVTLTSTKQRIHNYNPAIVVTGLHIYQREQPDKLAVEIDTAIIQLDIVASLWSLSPIFGNITIDGAKIRLTFNDGKWGVLGFPVAISSTSPVTNRASTSPSALQTTSTASNRDVKKLMEILRHEEIVNFRNVYLQISNDEGAREGLMVEHLTVDGPKAQRYFSGSLLTDGGDQLDLNVIAEGEFLRWPNIQLRGNLTAKSVDIKPWLPLFAEVIQQNVGIKFNQFRMATEIQVEWNKEAWQLSGDVRVPILDIDWRDRTLPILTEFSTQLYAKGDQKSWQVWLDGGRLIVGGTPYPLSDLYFSSRKLPEWQVTMTIDTVSLQPLKQVLDTVTLPRIVNKLFRVLNPRGELDQLVFRLYPDRETFDFDLAAVLNNVAVDSWGRAPSAENVSGTLRMTAKEGMLDLDSRDFVLGLDHVFDDDWRYQQAIGQLYWRLTDDVYSLRTDQMHVVADEGTMNARLRLNLPRNGEPVNMGLEASISEGDASYTEKYLPVKIGKYGDLMQWLKNSIRGAAINDGAFIWHGPLTATAAPNDVTWGLYVNVTDGELMYSPDWPELKDINGLVLVGQDSIEVTAHRARIYDSQVKSLSASIPDLKSADFPRLNIQTQVAVDGADGMKVLRNTPIADVINHAADNWAIDGDLDVQFGLDMPLSARHKTEINVTATTDNARFSLLNPAIDFQNIAGQIHYSTAKGLYATDVKLRLYDQLSKLDIDTDLEADTVKVGLSGSADIANIQRSFGQDWSPWIQGVTSYRAELIRPHEGAVQLRVNSDLKGVTIPLPAPLGKTAKVSENLTVDVTIIPEKGSVAIKTTLGKDITSLLRWDGQRIQSGIVYFGQGKPKLPDAGVHVAGVLPFLDMMPWYKWWESYNAASTSSASITPKSATQPAKKMTDRTTMGWQDVSVNDLEIKQFRIKDYSLANGRFSVLSDPRGTHIRLTSPTITGAMTLSDKAPWMLDIEQLVLPESLLPSRNKAAQKRVENQEREPETVKRQDAEPTTLDEDLLAGMDPHNIPVMDISVRDIRMGTRKFGTVNLQARKTTTGVILQELKGTFGGLSLNGSLAWNLQDGKHDTHYQGSIFADDLRDVMIGWGYPNRITTKKAQFTTDIAWVGSPALIEVKNMKGRVGINLKTGRFVSPDSNTGVLRVFGILNTDAITRRLQLDFSDLFRSGVTFDRIKGVITLDEGLITLVEPLDVSGPSSHFRLEGDLDVSEKMLNLELVVTLPVTGNLPLISLMLGQPQIAGAIYLFDKVLSQKIKNLASVHYEIKGPFDQPEVKLDKLFSGKMKKH